MVQFLAMQDVILYSKTSIADVKQMGTLCSFPRDKEAGI
jgi:hypothetical protein